MDNLRKGGDLEEVEIDLRDSSDSEEFEQPETLWKADRFHDQEEKSIHSSSLVDISDTKPLLDVRDPRGMNDCLKVANANMLKQLSYVS